MSIVIESPVLGSIDIEHGDIYSFIHGIPGFEDSKRFVIVQSEPGTPFVYFQSLDRSELVLLAADPFLFFPEYDFEVSEQVTEELGIESRGDVAVWCVVTIPEKMDDATINLLAPIIVNRRSRAGRQTILTSTNYVTKHPLFAAAAEAESAHSGGEGDAGTRS